MHERTPLRTPFVLRGILKAQPLEANLPRTVRVVTRGVG